MVAILHFVNPLPFKKYLGSTMPILVFVLAFLLGLFLIVLLPIDQLKIKSKKTLTGLRQAAIWAVVFFVPIVILDYYSPFPKNTNVLPPESLLFYPVMAYLVEIIFHLLPLVVLYNSLVWMLKTSNKSMAVWISILLVSLAEPLFQVLSFQENASWLKETYVFIHILGINMVSLILFKRYDFISMYALRFCYYGLWHILWGVWRLEIIF